MKRAGSSMATASHLPHSRGLTWREKARSAGMGTRIAMKKATMLLMDVSATLVPVRLKHSPIRSCQDRTGTLRSQRRGRSETWQGKNSDTTAVNICQVL